MRLLEQNFSDFTRDEQAIVNKAKKQICDLYTELLRSSYVRDKVTTIDHDKNGTTLTFDFYISSLDKYPRYSLTIQALKNGDITLEATQRGGIQLAKSNDIQTFIASARTKIMKNPPLKVDWSKYAEDWVERHDARHKTPKTTSANSIEITPLAANDRTAIPTPQRREHKRREHKGAKIISFPIAPRHTH